MPTDQGIAPYLRGERLYGEDLSDEEIDRWYRDETEGYAELGAATEPRYHYHALNLRHGFRYLPSGPFEHVMGLGSAWAEEFRPLLGRVGRITVVEPSSAFVRPSLDQVPLTYLAPGHRGALPLPDSSCDLATCFGVLHHIPNVRFVIGELARCLRPAGFLLLREPIVSMGDWRVPRPGLTAHERGIPRRLLREMLEGAGFRVVHQHACGFPLLLRVAARLGVHPFAVDWLTALDAVASGTWPQGPYHRTGLLGRLGATSAYFVLQKES